MTSKPSPRAFLLASGLALAAWLSIGVEASQKKIVSFDVPGAVATQPFKVSSNGFRQNLWLV